MVSKNLVRLAALVLALAATGIHAASPITYKMNDCSLKGTIGMVAGEYAKNGPVISSWLESGCAKQTSAEFLNASAKDDLVSLLRAMAVTHNTLKDILPDVIEKMGDVACSAFIAAHKDSKPVMIVRYMEDAQIAKLRPNCFSEEVLTAMTPAQIAHITIPAESPPALFVKLLLENGHFLENMTSDQFTQLVGADFAGCSGVDPATFKDMKPEVTKIIDSQCLTASAAKWTAVKENGVLRVLTPSAFSKYPQNTSQEAAKTLPPSFIRAVDSGVTDSRCGEVNVFTFSPAHAGAVSKDCFQNSLAKYEAKVIKPLFGTNYDDFAAFFKNAPSDIFSGMKEYSDFEKLLAVAGELKSDASLFEALKVEQLRDLASHEKFCESLTLTAGYPSFKYADSITAECFAKTPLPTKQALLGKHALQLKENILASLEPESEEIAKLAPQLESLAKARPAILASFGTDASTDKNPCKKLNVKLLQSSLKSAGKHLHVNCIKAMEGYPEIKLTDGLRSYPQVLIASLDLPAKIDAVKEEFPKMNETTWKELAIPKVCALLKAENFTSSAMKVMTADCFNEIKNVQALPKTLVEHLPESLLKDPTAKAQLARINKDHFTTNQKKILFPETPAPSK